MRATTLLTAVAVAACGGGVPPQSTAIVNPPAAPAATTCTDVGVILRGPVDNAARAGVAREATIAAACKDDRWSQAVLACVGRSRKPAECLDKLTHEQHAGYDAHLAQWSEQFGGDEYGGVTYGAATRVTDCTAVTGDIGGYPPLLDPNAPERDWVIAARKRTIVASCESAQWREETKECLADGDQPVACLVDEPSHDTLEGELTAIDELAAKIAAAKKKPASIDCKRVVAVWYADASWKDKIVGAKDRAKQIAASRAAMQTACVADKWTDTMRACIVVSGGERCFDVANVTAWTFPAASVTVANAPRECADYAASIQRLVTCDKIPQAARDAMKQAYDVMAAGWATIRPDANAIAACKAANDAVLQMGKVTCNW